MTERAIFLEALEKRGATERAAYLAEACGADADLRQRVDLLLQSHEQASRFLATPVLGHGAAAGATPGSATETHAPGSPCPDDDGLTFLTPSERPGSLGRLDHYDVLEVVGRG